MKSHLKQGWQLAVKHFYIVILLFLYQLLWGFFLYRFIDSVVTPLLKRFPSNASYDSAVQLFISEAQFQLLKTDLITPYVWLLGGLFAARMLLTPMINAGLYYSLHNSAGSGGTQFIIGIRKAWKPVTLLYWLEMLLVLAPAWWLLPRAFKIVMQGGPFTELIQNLLPSAFIWLVWAVLLHLLFLSMQFGVVSGNGAFRSLWHGLRHIIPYVGITIIMWAIGAGIGLLVSSVSFIWAGLLALILHQGYHLLRTMMKVWTVAAQYDCLQSKMN